jgi:hypothetical protein
LAGIFLLPILVVNRCVEVAANPFWAIVDVIIALRTGLIEASTLREVAAIVDPPSSGNERTTNVEHPVGCPVAQYRSQPVEKCQPEQQGARDTENQLIVVSS